MKDIFQSLNHPHDAAASDCITPRTLSRRVSISPPASAAAQAGMKFAVAHNTPAFGQTKKQPHFTASGKVSDRRMKVQGYINEAPLFVF